MDQSLNAIETLRSHRAASQNLIQAKLSDQNRAPDWLEGLIGFMMATALLTGLFSGIYHKSILHGLSDLFTGAVLGIFVYGAWPLVIALLTLTKIRRWPSHIFSTYPKGQKMIGFFILGWFLVFSFNQSAGYLVQTLKANEVKNTSAWQHKRKVHEHKKRAEFLPIQSNLSWAIIWLITTLALIQISTTLRKRRASSLPKLKNPKSALAKVEDQPFRLWLGASTGKLAKLSHGSSLAPHQQVSLSLEEATQNILILGGIGSGKTTRAIHPLLAQLLDQNCGGLIFDIKGDFQKSVSFFSEQTQRQVTFIGPGHHSMNLLKDLTPEIAASFLKSVFLLNGKNQGEAFWIDTASELCRNTLGILSFSSSYYSLQGLYQYLFDTESRLAIDSDVETHLTQLDEKSFKLLKGYWQYQEKIFDQFDEKVKAGVYATIAQVLSPFNHPDLITAFCEGSENHTPMESVLDGEVYLVVLPLSLWGLAAKVVYTLIKLRLYNVMQNRTHQPTWNQERPVFFMCDEFQEIVSANKDGLSDLNFWDKSRSTKTIGIISAQSISSFYAAIGDRDIAHALLQNFRQKICFKTEDTTTLNYFNSLLDRAEVERTTTSVTRGKQDVPGRVFNSHSQSFSQNKNVVDKAVLSPQVFRLLQTNEAIALLSIRGQSMDDILKTTPIFV